jgi:hypothetical protein
MNGQPHAAGGPRVEWRDEGQARQLLSAALWEPPPEASAAPPPPPHTAAETTEGSGTRPNRRRELLGACLAVLLLAVGVYAGFQAGQERRAVLQPTEPAAGSQGFDVESAADLRQLRSLPRETPPGRSAAAEEAAPVSRRTEAKPGAVKPPGGSTDEEPLLSATVPGVTTVEDPLPDAGSLELDGAEALLP